MRVTPALVLIAFITVISTAILFGITCSDYQDLVYTQNILPETLKEISKGWLQQELFFLAYLIFICFVLRNMAQSLIVSVEGAFLHIVQGNFVRVDRKLHFHTIVDQVTVDDILIWHFGLMALYSPPAAIPFNSLASRIV